MNHTQYKIHFHISYSKYCLNLGNFEEAMTWCDTSFQQAPEAGFNNSIASAYEQKARILFARCDVALSKSLFNISLSKFVEVKEKRRQLTIMPCISEVLLTLDLTYEALLVIAACEARAKQMTVSYSASAVRTIEHCYPVLNSLFDPGRFEHIRDDGRRLEFDGMVRYVLSL